MPISIPQISAGQAKDKAFSLFNEFRTFLFKGNLVDMAVGIVIGGAFSGLVKSFLEKIIMPFIAVLTSPGGEKAKEAKDALSHLSTDLHGVNIPWGGFIADLVNFIILGAVVFFVIVKLLGALVKAKEEPPAPALPTKEQLLLTEIRDLLAKQQGLATEGPKPE
jgi:large conductance mechanosensitive channel